MYKLLTKNGQTFAFGLGVLVTAIFLGSVFSGMSSFQSMSEADRYDTTIFNFGLYASIGLTILGIVAMILFAVFHLASDPKGAIKGIAGMAVLAIIFGIAYATAKPETSEALMAAEKDFSVTSGASKFITGAITSALALSGIAIVAFVGSEIRNFFK